MHAVKDVPPGLLAAPPAIGPHETVDELVRVAKRDGLRLRRSFLQLRTPNGLAPGPLAEFVAAGDHRGLILYLLLMTKASGGDFSVALAASAWARALGLPNPTARTATSAVSKTWLRIEQRGLITRTRVARRAVVTPLMEDGSGQPYTNPGAARDSHFSLPNAFWLEGPEKSSSRWYEVLQLPDLAMLLIARSLGDGFRLPYHEVPAWYGISADSAARGLSRLTREGILDRNKWFKAAPLAPQGYTAEYHYTLQPPFGPIGHSQVRRAAP